MSGKTLTPVLILAALGLSACTIGARATETPTEEPTSQPMPEAQFPPAEIVNDEGGPVVITGDVNYTYPFFTAGVAEPIVILEDQAGFVERNRDFIFPVESQVLGQITSDFYTSPFSYSLTLPLVPRGTLRDVDNDAEEDRGVMVFAVAYWTNIFGDAYLEKRDQSGGGWSSAYASTRVSDDRANYLEVYGGKYVVYAPDDGQGFPAGFGEDGLLFTEDDPIVQLPQGWTVVDLDSDPFTFDRSREPEIDLLEPERIALADFSDLSYTEAFDAMLEKMRTEYAFTEYKGIDWQALSEALRPRFETAESRGNTLEYFLALRDFLWSIPDGHIGMDMSGLSAMFQQAIAGGLGLAIQELDDGRVLVYHVVEDSPADEAGIVFGAEILEIDGKPIGEAISEVVPWSSPFSTEHTKRLQQLRYVMRFPQGTEVEIRFQNPGSPARTASLNVSNELESFNVSSFFADVTGAELPVEFEILDSGFGYVKVTDFFDNELLTVQLWERMIQDLNENQVPGLIIDLRLNNGGSGYLADQMAAYFFDDELVAGNTGYYDDSSGDFYTDPGDAERLFPPREDLRYYGTIAVIVGPACASACEFFAYDLTLQDRVTVVGRYPTAGLGGSVEDFIMPEDISVRFTIGRAVDAEGKIHIEGRGVAPDVPVPLTEENFDAIYREGRDLELETALEVVRKPRGSGVVPAGPPTLATQAESVAAIQTGVPFLEDLAVESYEEELFEPATRVYNVPLVSSRQVLWGTGWCAAPNQFEENWENIRLAMELDGEEVSIASFVIFEGPSGDQLCRLYYIALDDWPLGEHVLTTEMTFTRSLDDGVSERPYAPGPRVYEYHVYITR